jgi:hypothetical protein
MPTAKRKTGINKTVVKKVVRAGANRPAAMAKKKRHDQRTPLPAKPQTTAAARLDGITKAKQFAAFAEKHGWWTEVKVDKQAGMVRTTCKRDDGKYKEVVTAEWSGDRVAKGGVVLSIVGGRTVLLRNVSAASKHIDGSKVVKREVQERRTRAMRQRPHRTINVRPDGTVEIDDEEDDVTPRHVPVGAHVVDTWYHIKATSPVVSGRGANKKTATKVLLRTGPFLLPNVTKFKERYEAEGATVLVVKHPTDKHCEICASPRKKTTAPPKKKVRR